MLLNASVMAPPSLSFTPSPPPVPPPPHSLTPTNFLPFFHTYLSHPLFYPFSPCCCSSTHPLPSSLNSTLPILHPPSLNPSPFPSLISLAPPSLQCCQVGQTRIPPRSQIRLSVARFSQERWRHGWKSSGYSDRLLYAYLDLYTLKGS